MLSSRVLAGARVAAGRDPGGGESGVLRAGGAGPGHRRPGTGCAAIRRSGLPELTTGRNQDRHVNGYVRAGTYRAPAHGLLRAHTAYRFNCALTA